MKSIGGYHSGGQLKNGHFSMFQGDSVGEIGDGQRFDLVSVFESTLAKSGAPLLWSCAMFSPEPFLHPIVSFQHSRIFYFSYEITMFKVPAHNQ